MEKWFANSLQHGDLEQTKSFYLNVKLQQFKIAFMRSFNTSVL